MIKHLQVEVFTEYVDIANLHFSDENVNLSNFHDFHLKYGPDVIKKILDTVIINYIDTDLNFYFSWKHEAPTWFFSNLENDGFVSLLLNKFEEYGISHRFFFYDNNLSDSKIEPSYYPIKSFPTWLGYTFPNSKKIDINSTPFKKKFICLNNLGKSHREIIFDFLVKYHEEHCYLSYEPMSPDNIRHRKLDSVSDNFMVDNVFVNNFQIESFCNIVNETKFTDGIYNIHITEKVDKCFSSLQPFVIVSTPGYLKKLKELGFQTFDRWWDESYDDELDSFYRLEKIKKTIDFISQKSYEELTNMYLEMNDVLDANYKLCEKYCYINLLKSQSSINTLEVNI